MSKQPRRDPRPPTAADLERVTIVAEKLAGLRSLLSREPTASELRDYVSVNVRFLLLDNNYQLAWNTAFAGERVIVPAIDANKLAGGPLTQQQFLQTAGGTMGPLTVAAIRMARGPAAERAFKEATSSRGPADPPTTDFTIQQFMESPCIVIDGVFARRRQVVQYVAYKAGGVHFGGPDDPRDAQAFELLDKQRKGTGEIKSEWLSHNPVYLEFLAIAQALVNSPDASRFIQRAASTPGTSAPR